MLEGTLAIVDIDKNQIYQTTDFPFVISKLIVILLIEFLFFKESTNWIGLLGVILMISSGSLTV